MVSEDGGFQDYDLSFSLCLRPPPSRRRITLTGGVNGISPARSTGSDDGVTIDGTVYEIEDGFFTLTPGSGAGNFAGDTNEEFHSLYSKAGGDVLSLAPGKRRWP